MSLYCYITGYVIYKLHDIVYTLKGFRSIIFYFTPGQLLVEGGSGVIELIVKFYWEDLFRVLLDLNNEPNLSYRNISLHDEEAISR